MVRVLIITSYSPSAQSSHQKSLDEFAAAVNNQERDVRVSYCSVQELVFLVKNGKTSVLLKGRELADDFDALSLRNMDKYPDFASTLGLYAEQYSVKVVNPLDIAHPVYGKVSQGFLFTANGVPTPDLVSSPNNETLLRYLESQKNEFPLIVKHNEGIKGLHNYLVKDATELHEVLRQEKQGFVTQPFIENEGELRVLTFGEQVEPLIFKKQGDATTHLNNTARGGGAVQLSQDEVPSDILADARKAASVTHRELGGVDVLLAKTGQWYVLEVNHTPALATGVLRDEKIARFVQYAESLGATK